MLTSAAVKQQKNGKAELSVLMTRFVTRLDKLRKQRGLTFEDVKKRGGKGQQTWNKWKRGSSPKVETLEATAKALEGVLLLDVQPKGSVRELEGPSAESVEIVSIVDDKPQAVREKIRDAVYRLAEAYDRTLTVPAAPGTTGQKSSR